MADIHNLIFSLLLVYPGWHALGADQPDAVSGLYAIVRDRLKFDFGQDGACLVADIESILFELSQFILIGNGYFIRFNLAVGDTPELYCEWLLLKHAHELAVPAHAQRFDKITPINLCVCGRWVTLVRDGV